MKYHKKVDTDVWSFRIPKEFSAELKKILYKLKMNINTFCVLSVVEYSKKINMKELKIADIELKDYIIAYECELKRNLISKVRNIHISKSLFIVRVRYDIFKLIMNKRPINEIIELILLYKKEAKYYPNNKKLMKEINFYMTFKSDTYEEFKKVIRDKLDIVKEGDYIERVSLQKMLSDRIGKFEKENGEE